MENLWQPQGKKSQLKTNNCFWGRRQGADCIQLFLAPCWFLPSARSWAGQPAGAWAAFRPGLCPAVSSRAELAQRHRAGLCRTLQRARGSLSTHTSTTPVNCRVSFLLLFPGAQCIQPYCCLLPTLKSFYCLHISHREETAVLRSCKAQDSVFPWAPNSTETRHAMLGAREMAQPWPARVPRALRVPAPSWLPQSPVNRGQGRLNFDTVGLAQLQDERHYLLPILLS